MSVEKETKKEAAKIVAEPKKYTALKTIKITCNGVFQLKEGEEIPSGISEPFIKSLINSNLIK